jgi:penicillin-binding protein 1A
MAHFGIDLDRHPRDLTLALGTGSTSPMALAGSYAVLANGGWAVAPLLIERITDAQGRTVFEAPPAAPRTEAERAVPERNVFLVNTLLSEVMRSGTGARAAQALGRGDLHGKTGTTDDAVDAWFAGFHATRVGVVWMGHPQPRSLGEGESGGGLALPVWVDTLREALKDVPEHPPAPPEGVTPTASGHWRYSEWLDRAPHERIGVPEERPDPAAAPVATPPPPVPPAAVPHRQGMSGAIVSAQS